MDLYKLHTRVLMPFVSETLGALADMADLSATANQGFQEDVIEYKLRAYAVSVVAKSEAGIQGKVIMNHPAETALLIGNHVRAVMLGEPSNEPAINDEISDALTEFSNTVIGLASNTLHRANVDIQFSAPLFVASAKDMAYITAGVNEIISVPIALTGCGTFHFSYLLHNKLK